MPTTGEVVGGPQARSVWDLPIGDLATAMTPANVRGHVIYMSAYGPVDYNDPGASFAQPFAMQVLPWSTGDKYIQTVT